jgi:chromosome segregation ATPase
MSKIDEKIQMKRAQIERLTQRLNKAAVTMDKCRIMIHKKEAQIERLERKKAKEVTPQKAPETNRFVKAPGLSLEWSE